MAGVTREEISDLVREELVHLLRHVPSVRHEVIGILSEVFAQRADLRAILERIDVQGGSIETLRTDFNRRMEEFAQRQEEHSQRLEEHSRRLEEHSREIVALRKDFNRGFAQLSRRISEMELTLGGLGARWGMMSESAFREGLAGMLTEETGLRVEH